MSPCERCGGTTVRDVVSRGGEAIGIQCATCNAPLGKRKNYDPLTKVSRERKVKCDHSERVEQVYAADGALMGVRCVHRNAKAGLCQRCGASCGLAAPAGYCSAQCRTDARKKVAT